MNIDIKAALLSALVFPGLGQLYKGDRVKGMIILVCVNISLRLNCISIFYTKKV